MTAPPPQPNKPAAKNAKLFFMLPAFGSTYHTSKFR
jgi:hypothetical protein